MVESPSSRENRRPVTRLLSSAFINSEENTPTVERGSDKKLCLLTSSATLNTFAISGIFYTFGYLLNNVMTNFDIAVTNSMISHGIMVSFNAIFYPVVLRLTVRFGCKWTTCSGLVLCCAGFSLASVAVGLPNYVLFIMGYGFIAGLGLSLLWSPFSLLQMNNATRSLDTRLNLMLCGCGVGLFLVPQLVSIILEYGYGLEAVMFGYAAFFAMLMVSYVVVLPSKGFEVLKDLPNPNIIILKKQRIKSTWDRSGIPSVSRHKLSPHEVKAGTSREQRPLEKETRGSGEQMGDELQEELSAVIETPEERIEDDGERSQVDDDLDVRSEEVEILESAGEESREVKVIVVEDGQEAHRKLKALLVRMNSEDCDTELRILLEDMIDHVERTMRTTDEDTPSGTSQQSVQNMEISEINGKKDSRKKRIQFEEKVHIRQILSSLVDLADDKSGSRLDKTLSRLKSNHFLKNPLLKKFLILSGNLLLGIGFHIPFAFYPRYRKEFASYSSFFMTIVIGLVSASGHLIISATMPWFTFCNLHLYCCCLFVLSMLVTLIPFISQHFAASAALDVLYGLILVCLDRFRLMPHVTGEVYLAYGIGSLIGPPAGGTVLSVTRSATQVFVFGAMSLLISSVMHILYSLLLFL